MYPENEEQQTTTPKQPDKSGYAGDKSGDMHIDEVCFQAWYEGKHMEWGE